MPTRLWYFNAPALAEPIRYLLSYVGTKFEDTRFANFEEFLKMKQTFPYGKVPVLELEGRTLHQTKAICRHLAKKAGLTGKSEWDELECDMAVETVDDMRTALASYHYDSNAESKASKKDTTLNTTVPYYMDKFEKQVGDNGGGFVKGQTTWADIYFVSMEPYFSLMAGSQLVTASRPNLKALQDKVNNMKGIKEYIASRPK